MKKYLVLVACLFLLSITSNAFAVNDLSSSGELVIGGAGTTSSLTIGLSPKVSARYVTDGTSTVTSQWYAIATVHPGGNVGYATAQNLNNIYSQTYETGAAVSTVLDDIPETANSASDWSGTIWSM